MINLHFLLFLIGIHFIAATIIYNPLNVNKSELFSTGRTFMISPGMITVSEGSDSPIQVFVITTSHKVATTTIVTVGVQQAGYESGRRGTITSAANLTYKY